MHYAMTQSRAARKTIELKKKRLTFFFGRFTSSFIEAHLFKVLSLLQEK